MVNIFEGNDCNCGLLFLKGNDRKSDDHPGHTLCKYCNLPFYRKRANFRRHLETVHGFTGKDLKRETNAFVYRGRVDMPKRPIQCRYCDKVCSHRTLVRSHLVFGARGVCENFPTTNLPIDLGTDLKKAKYHAKSLASLCKYLDDDGGNEEQKCTGNFPTELTKDLFLSPSIILDGYERYCMSLINPMEANVSEKGKNTRTRMKFLSRKPKSRVAMVRRLLYQIYPPNSTFTVVDLRKRLLEFLKSPDDLGTFKKSLKSNKKEICSSHCASIWSTAAHLCQFLSVHITDGCYAKVLETLEKHFRNRSSRMEVHANLEREENQYSQEKDQLLDLRLVETLFEDAKIQNLIENCKRIVETDSIADIKTVNALKNLVTFVLLLKTGKRAQVILSIMHKDVLDAEPTKEYGIKLLKMNIKPGPHLDSFKRCKNTIRSLVCLTEPVYNLILLLAKIERIRIRCSAAPEYNPEWRYLIGAKLSSSPYAITSDLVNRFVKWLDVERLEKSQNNCIRRTLITTSRTLLDITDDEEIELCDYFDHSFGVHEKIYKIKTVKFRDSIESTVKIHPAIILDYMCKINLPGGEREFETLDDLRSHLESLIPTPSSKDI